MNQSCGTDMTELELTLSYKLYPKSLRYFLFLHIFQLLNKNGHKLIKDVLMMNLYLEEKKQKIFFYFEISILVA
jgi:hypothetical protein